MVTLKILFWICLAICVYTYVGYGFLLYLLVLIKRLIKGAPQQSELPSDSELPDVAFMVCAFNEEDIVEMKMQNIHELDYPKEKLHVVCSLMYAIISTILLMMSNARFWRAGTI